MNRIADSYAKTHPILMTGPNVRRIQGGTKTVTRRCDLRWVKVKAGDLLWVRETWRVWLSADGAPLPVSQCQYRADWEIEEKKHDSPRQGCVPWRPSIFMPREACRLWLRAADDAKLERLQDITCVEIKREGIRLARRRRRGIDRVEDLRAQWIEGWNKINDKPGRRWEDNPKVAVIRFEVAH